MKKKETQAQDEKVGLECDRCGCRHFNTLDTRKRVDSIARIKECRHCGKRKRTIEIFEEKLDSTH